MRRASDYCARYAAFYRRLQRDPAPPEIWADWADVAKQWTKPLAPDEIAQKSLWRNRRLAAHAAHKLKQQQS